MNASHLPCVHSQALFSCFLSASPLWSADMLLLLYKNRAELLKGLKSSTFFTCFFSLLYLLGDSGNPQTSLFPASSCSSANASSHPISSANNSKETRSRESEEQAETHGTVTETSATHRKAACEAGLRRVCVRKNYW